MSGEQDRQLLLVMRAIVAGDDSAFERTLAERPALASMTIHVGAARKQTEPYFFDSIKHYVYAGDTTLHVAAMAYRHAIAGSLLASGANVHAKNRRGAEALHYAVDGGPGNPAWDPAAQVATIQRLLQAGANPNATDAGGVTPLHRAIRNRCAAAVRSLLDGGADPNRANGHGSSPLELAQLTTGRSGSGADAKEQQAEILRMLSGVG